MKRIAIIDDNKDILILLERFLSRSDKNVKVSTFLNPTKALESVKRGDFDVVLLDMLMPEMSGIKFLKSVRMFNNKTKIIVITSEGTLDRVLVSHQSGADGFILKPFKDLTKVRDEVILN